MCSGGAKRPRPASHGADYVDSIQRVIFVFVSSLADVVWIVAAISDICAIVSSWNVVVPVSSGPIKDFKVRVWLCDI